jgi:hypothetical protein
MNKVEKVCEYCWKLFIANIKTQKYHIKCWNILNKERSKRDNKIKKDKRKEQKERIYWKAKTKD